MNFAFVDTGHLLLGLMRENEGVGTQMLRTAKVAFTQVKDEVMAEMESQANSTIEAKPTLTPRAKRALQFAAAEAQDLEHNYIGTGHLLLGLLHEKDTNLAKILSDSGLNLESGRRQIRHFYMEDNENSALGTQINKRITTNFRDWLLFFSSALLHE